jgi:hypothetical protein
MVKKINIKLWLFKWLIIGLAIVINGLALLSWLDLLLFGQPKNFFEWSILISNTSIGWVMIHVCYVNWDFNIYDHFMDKRDNIH